MSDSFEYIQKMVKFAEGILGLAQEHGVMPRKPGRRPSVPKGRPKGSRNKPKVAKLATTSVANGDAQEGNANG